MHILDILIAYFWLIWIIYWQITALQAQKTVSNPRWFLIIGFRIVIVILVILFIRIHFLNSFMVNSYTKSIYTNSFLSIFGFSIAVLGFLLSVWARIYIGRNWGQPMSEKEKTTIITKGPYAYIRHPIYTGIFIAMLGTTLVTTIYWAIPLIFLTIYFIYSAKIEEKNLIKKYPKEYTEYIKKSKSFIPFIY